VRNADLPAALCETRSGLSVNRRANRLRALFIISETCFALVVLVGAGLLTRSFLTLRAVEPGFEADNLLTVKMSLPRNRYPEASQQLEFYRAVRERIQTVPGVEGVSAVSNLPMTGSHQRTSIYAENTPRPAPGEEDFALNRQIQDDYFNVMGIPVIQGSDFDERTAAAGNPPVVIVDQALASHLWPDENALGKRLKYGGPNDTRWPWMEVVGVVGNTHHFSLDGETEKGMYRPFMQEPMRTQTLVVKSLVNTNELVSQVRHEVWSVDPNLPVYDVSTMDQLVRDSYWETAAQMRLLSAFSVIAIVLAALGVYGVVG